MGAGFSPWEERTGPHPAPGPPAELGLAREDAPGGCAAPHRTVPGVRPGSTADGTRGSGRGAGLRGGWKDGSTPGGGMDGGTLFLHGEREAGRQLEPATSLCAAPVPTEGRGTGFGHPHAPISPAWWSPPPHPFSRGALQQGSGGAGGLAGGWRVPEEPGEMASRHLRSKLLSAGQAGPALAESHPCHIDRHGLLSMHITRQGISPLRLPPSLPPQALLFSQGCCFPLALLGMLASPRTHGSRGVFLGMGALGPSGSPGGVVGRARAPQEGGKAALPSLLSPAQNWCSVYLFIYL